MKAILFSFLLLNISISFANTDTSFVQREQNLTVYLTELRAAKTDMEKENANAKFKSFLLETISLPGAFEYEFSSLRTIGTIKSPDKTFRFFNWNVEQSDETNKYYCFVLYFDVKKKEWKTIELIDNSTMLPPQPTDYLDEKNWYGALYYKIIPIQKSGKTIYTILGYDATSNMSHTKLIDVISFSGNHVKLGSPIFKIKNETLKRVYFEHSKKCVMSLNYDEERKKIIFDHLSPESPSMEGFREFYVPDMSYDAFSFIDNKWVLEEDVIAISKTNASKPMVYFKQNENGEIVEEEVSKKTWIDPSNPNAPASPNTHVAAMPEDNIKPNETAIKPKKEKSKINTKTKRNRKQKSAITGTVSTKKR